ncbi:hypothetical protein PVE_R1G4680 [Pseudomonas veronii 1YdBTEX2]|uniref:Uncharacterized protein n=1 Tax=Pseudomonas veronii 1YdBTEX2 TaxID=1295141 RepID=A0A1D3K2R0_PSEVE|nr:hypothetical protein PVE_R1G4680 [Pseudomonas veronii 1YdBTEX2]
MNTQPAECERSINPGGDAPNRPVTQDLPD